MASPKPVDHKLLFLASNAPPELQPPLQDARIGSELNGWSPSAQRTGLVAPLSSCPQQSNKAGPQPEREHTRGSRRDDPDDVEALAPTTSEPDKTVAVCSEDTGCENRYGADAKEQAFPTCARSPQEQAQNGSER